MTDFRIYPNSLEDLFVSDTFASVMRVNQKRLMERLFITFTVAMHRIPTLCQLFLESPGGLQYELTAPIRLVDERAVAARLQQAAGRLCFWMCDLRIVDGTRLEEGASETIAANYKVIDEYRTEFFSLLVSYDFYRYYMSMATGRIIPDWFAGRSMGDVLELCAVLARTPYNSDLVFKRLAL